MNILIIELLKTHSSLGREYTILLNTSSLICWKKNQGVYVWSSTLRGQAYRCCVAANSIVINGSRKSRTFCLTLYYDLLFIGELAISFKHTLFEQKSISLKSKKSCESVTSKATVASLSILHLENDSFCLYWKNRL